MLGAARCRKRESLSANLAGRRDRGELRARPRCSPRTSLTDHPLLPYLRPAYARCTRAIRLLRRALWRGRFGACSASSWPFKRACEARPACATVRTFLTA